MILTVYLIECDVQRTLACTRRTQVFARDHRDAEAKYIELGGKVETVNAGGGYARRHTCTTCQTTYVSGDASSRDDSGRRPPA